MKLNDNFISRDVGGEHVLVSVDGKGFSGLARGNETAAFIIKMLKKGTTREAMINALLDEYDAEKTAVEKDVDKILDKLRSIGALSE